MRNITTVLFFIFCIPVQAQFILSGKITDQQTGEPLPGANIVVTNTANGVTADEYGNFELSVDDEKISITVSFIGYETQHLNIASTAKRIPIVMVSTNLNLSEVTVIGFDNHRRLIETAGSIAVLSQQEIQRSTNVSLSQALNIIPGVRMEENGPGGTSRLSIRGSLLRSPWGIRNIKLYWNDIPLTDPSGTSARFNAIDVNSIGTLEVIKGPSGSIYGAGTGGVINMTSSQAPYGEKSLELSSTIGSFGLRRNAATVRVGTETANILVSYLDQQLAGYRDHQRSDKKVFNLASTFNVGEQRTLSLHAFHYDGTFELPGALTKAEVQDNPRKAMAFNAANDCRLSNKSTGLALSQRYTINEKLENTTSVSLIFNAMDHPWGNSAYYNGYSIASSQGVSARTRFMYTSMLGNIESKFMLGVELQSSYEIEKEYKNDGGETGPLQADYEFDATQSILFAQAEFNLPYDVIVTLGASYNNTAYDFSERMSGRTGLEMDFDPSFAPRIGIVKKIHDRVAVHGSIGYGFSPPTQYEVQTQAGINESLKAEEGINYEAGIRGSLLNQKLNLDVTAYTFHLRNAILPRYNEAQEEYFQNTGTTRQNGIEALLSYIVVKSDETFITTLKPWISYTYNDYTFHDYRKESLMGNEIISHDYSGNRITGIPSHLLNAGINMETKVGLYLMSTMNFVDEIPLMDDNSVYTEKYTVVGGKIGFKKKVFSQLTLDTFAGIDNAINARYNNFLSLNAFDGRFYNPAPTRNFFGGLSVKYNFN